MINNTVAMLALRARALTLSVATTGSTSLSATATGYARAAGSFITDGFAVGQEFTPTGFAVNATHIITGVSATAITTPDTIAVEAAAAGRTLVVGLPALRAFENVVFTPTAGRWFVEEDYLPGPVAQETLGPLGQIETLPQYILKLYGIAGTGVSAIYRMADALLTLFAPRTALVLSTGDVVRVRTNPAPYRSQLIPGEPGWSVCVITVPCMARSANSI